METKKIICIICPQGCEVTVCGDKSSRTVESIKGFGCKRGKTYAENEFFAPVRILTSSVKTTNKQVPLVAVRTSKPIPKELLFAGMEEIKRLVVDKVNSGDVIVPNFLGTGADLIASGSVE
ncbi:MAG TPA: DUF1667 domain-containing protein [Bacillota bacterium]|nr:DUF1667 domain-containing protein [Bacillota bacterium]